MSQVLPAFFIGWSLIGILMGCFIAFFFPGDPRSHAFGVFAILFVAAIGFVLASLILIWITIAAWERILSKPETTIALSDWARQVGPRVLETCPEAIDHTHLNASLLRSAVSHEGQGKRMALPRVLHAQIGLILFRHLRSQIGLPTSFFLMILGAYTPMLPISRHEQLAAISRKLPKSMPAAGS